jgi:hypothetical protein
MLIWTQYCFWDQIGAHVGIAEVGGSWADAIRVADAVDDAGGGAVRHELQDLHCSPVLFYQVGFGKFGSRVVASFHEYIRPNDFNQTMRGILIKAVHVIDAAESGQHPDTVSQRIDWPRRPLSR